jgi:hypothetical protein
MKTPKPNNRRRYLAGTTAVLTAFGLASAYWIKNKDHMEEITVYHKAEACFDNGELCYKNLSNAIRLIASDGLEKDFRGQTWGIAWGNANGNEWPDLYLNHHKESNTKGRFPTSHLVLDLGNSMNSRNFLTLGKGDQHSAIFHDFDGDNRDEILETIGGRSGKASETNQATFNQLHKTEAQAERDYAAALGIEQPGARGRQVSPFVLNRKLFIAFLNQPRKDGKSKPNLMERSGKGRFQASQIQATSCRSGKCAKQLFDLEEYKSLSFGLISKDATPDLALCQNNKDASIKLLIRTSERIAGMQYQSASGHKSKFCIPSYFPQIDNYAVATESAKGVEIMTLSDQGNALKTQQILPLIRKQRSKDMAIADMNNDGIPDIIFLQQGKNGTEPSTVIAFYLSKRENCSPQSRLLCYRTKTMELPYAPAPRNFALADFNNDGTLDIMVGAGKTPPGPYKGGQYILLAGKSTGDWLTLNIRCPNGTNGIGTLGSVRTNSANSLQMKTSGAGHETQHDSRLHYGLGVTSSQQATIAITWPNGQKTNVRNQAINRVVDINGAGTCTKAPD